MIGFRVVFGLRPANCVTLPVSLRNEILLHADFTRSRSVGLS